MTKNYKNAGVDLEKAGLLGSFFSDELNIENKFASVFEHKVLKNYYLVSCTDGIGTKIIPLLKNKYYKTIANDLVAMNLNDLICTGSNPLFFLDYIAANKIDVSEIKEITKELKLILNDYDTELLGGETAELGSIIQKDLSDIAGFLVGIVKKENLIKSSNVKEGDLVIALKSSGVHSNGFSLINKLFEGEINEFLVPTYIYAKEVLKLSELGLINSMANITGGGIVENLSRAIPKGCCARLDKNKLEKQSAFKKIEQKIGEEAYDIFNMGVGFCLVIDPKNKQKVFEVCKKYEPYVLGKVIQDEKNRCIWLG